MSGFLKECRNVKLSIEPDGPTDVCPNCGGVEHRSLEIYKHTECLGTYSINLVCRNRETSECIIGIPNAVAPVLPSTF